MIVTITDVDQRYSLRDQSFSNLLTLELPSGARFQVRVDDEVVQTVLSEAQNGPTAEKQGHVPDPTGRVLPSPEEVTYWGGRAASNGHSNGLESNPFELGDTLLQETLDKLEDEPQRPATDWPERQVAHHIEEGPVEWETLPDTQLPPSIKRVLRASGINPIISIADLDNLKLEISKQLAARPKAGQVDWETGPRRRIEAVPRRKIASDEAGNPIPPGGILELQEEKDPGEVREDDGDEGVQQA